MFSCRSSVCASDPSAMFSRYFHHALMGFLQTFVSIVSRDEHKTIKFWGRILVMLDRDLRSRSSMTKYAKNTVLIGLYFCDISLRCAVQFLSLAHLGTKVN